MLAKEYKNIVLILFNRIGSSRLFGKAFLPIYGKNAMQWIIDRVYNNSIYINKCTIATTTNSLDNEIIIYCKTNNLDYYRGNEYDVFDRLFKTAKISNADIIVDLTSDCPLVDYHHVDSLISTLIYENLDYISNDVIDRSWPDGLDIQCYTMNALEQTYKYKSYLKKEYRMNGGWNIPTLQQHLDEYIQENLTSIIPVPNFKIKHIKAPDKYNHPEIGITLDTKEDYNLLRTIFAYFIPREGINFKAENVIDWLLNHPEILEINKKIQRNIPGNGK